MRKIGLALSGGGFRATLFHLGLVRFLHDAGILSNVSHITSVSGGSIIAAHLCLNWERYNGSTNDFEAAALELLDFIRLDIRNRILRRYPLAFPLRVVRRLAGQSNRKLTRTGLLEYHYEKYLYGDTSLFQLPEYPSLHLLATNLSEGHLCSFNRDGLWAIRREKRHTIRIDQIQMGLATVPMAVAASSAFPGFFPPFVLTGRDVGAKGGEFGRQAYTDGGVFDNLGVRMFHCIAQTSAKDRIPWDCILVSDSGRPFETQSSLRSGGLIRTAMRASDILMDRVWQLETETFKDSSDFAFARITEIVDQEEDPTAMHAEVQRQLPTIRTDLDRFTPVEINSLLRHGYCVARKICHAHRELFGIEPASKSSVESPGEVQPHAATPESTIDSAEDEVITVPANLKTIGRHGKWQTVLNPHNWSSKLSHAKSATYAAAKTGSAYLARRKATPVTLRARTLHASAPHRIWSTLLDYRDWVSFIYIPIIVPILVLLPFYGAQMYERSQRNHQIIQSIAQQSRDLEQMTRLMDGPSATFTGVKAETLPAGEKTDLTGFLILQDLRIIDLRNWLTAKTDSKDSKAHWVYGYRRLKVLKETGSTNNSFHINVLAISPLTEVRFPAQQLMPKLYLSNVRNPQSEERRPWLVGADFSKVPAGEPVDIIYEHSSPGLFLRSGIGSTSLSFDVEAETVELSRWLLMPQGREYRTWQLIRYPTGYPEKVEYVKPVTEFRASDFAILAFKLLALKAGYTYELTWFYR
jgi:predicted acylesterase/phospholipase RssA